MDGGIIVSQPDALRFCICVPYAQGLLNDYFQILLAGSVASLKRQSALNGQNEARTSLRLAGGNLAFGNCSCDPIFQPLQGLCVNRRAKRTLLAG